jgi:hypothetical protein
MDDLEASVRKLEQAFAGFAQEIRLAYRYIQPDSASSLTKSRIVMEKRLLSIYKAEMGVEPKKPLLGDILADNQFTRKIERRILSRMNSIRDMGNLGPHGEVVQPSDAQRVLDDLCTVLDCCLSRYASQMQKRQDGDGVGTGDQPAGPLPTSISPGAYDLQPQPTAQAAVPARSTWRRWPVVVGLSALLLLGLAMLWLANWRGSDRGQVGTASPPSAPQSTLPSAATTSPPGSKELQPRGTQTQAQREKRGNRWKLLFNTHTGPDYLKQLNSLGAILAIPVREVPKPQYKVVRDLTRRPAQLLDEDTTKIQQIYWVDQNLQSVHDLMTALGLPIRPSHFVAYMPEALENKLFELAGKD